MAAFAPNFQFADEHAAYITGHSMGCSCDDCTRERQVEIAWQESSDEFDLVAGELP